MPKKYYYFKFPLAVKVRIFIKIKLFLKIIRIKNSKTYNNKLIFTVSYDK
jgi:hypothetical protein